MADVLYPTDLLFDAVSRSDLVDLTHLLYLALQPTTPLDDALSALDDGSVDGLLLLTAPAGGGSFDQTALLRTLKVPRGTPMIVDGGLEPRHFDTLWEARVDLVVLGRTLFDAPDIGERVLRLRRDLEGAATPF